MSDSLSQREIEDVLSSIRRLVSQEVSLARAPSDRLLLTPSLRVVTNSDMPAAANGAVSRHAAPDSMAAPETLSEAENLSEAVRRIAAEGRDAQGAGVVSGSGAAPDNPTPSAPPPESSGYATGPDDGGADVVIDESTLRELVAQILREELHGAMGERLTRSIRKLVRAEVARALTEREFL